MRAILLGLMLAAPVAAFAQIGPQEVPAILQLQANPPAGRAALGSDGITSIAGPEAFIYNNNATNLQKTRAVLAKVRNNQGDARILFIGDSTTFGSKSSPTQNLSVKNSYPTQLSAMLNSLGVSSNANSFLGGGQTGSDNHCISDIRMACGSWSFNLNSIGGTMMYSGATGTPLVFTPETLTTGFRVWYLQYSGGGIVTAKISGQTAVSINTAGSNGLTSIDITGSLGLNTLTMNFVSGGGAFFIGTEALNTASSSVRVINSGWPGSTVVNWNDASNAWDPLNAVGVIAPDLSVIDLGINDWNNGESLSVYQSGLQNLISKVKLSGDCIIVTPAPSAITTKSRSIQQTFVNTAISLGIQNSCVVIDNWNRWISFEIQSPLGLYGDSALHPSGPGYADFASPILKLIEQNIGTGGAASPNLRSLYLTGQVSAGGASAGTLSNAPVAGNPTYWMPVQVDGVWYVAPLWPHQ